MRNADIYAIAGIMLSAFRMTRRAWLIYTGRDVEFPVELKCGNVSLGNAGGVWCILPHSISPASIVYSFGVGEDVSFELALIRQFGATVHAFDPTPRSLQWLRSQPVVPDLKLHELGIGAVDGLATFYPPLRKDHVSYSTCFRKETAGEAVRCQIRRLRTIMNQLGHESIDLLKMDIEGSEYEVLPDVLATKPPRQLLIEFHHRWKGIGPKKTEEAIGWLRASGYKIFHVSATGMEYSFLREGPPAAH